MTHLVELTRCWNSIEAGLHQSKLEAEGIESVLFDFEAANVWGSLALPIRVMVLDDDLPAARHVLAQNLSS